MVERAGTDGMDIEPSKNVVKLTGADLINNCFHTCKTSEEVNEFIARFNDPAITTAFMVGMNTAYYNFRNTQVSRK